jgi:TrpR-related protein YerC/YecD
METKDLNEFSSLFLKLRTSEEIQRFLKDIFTRKELETFLLRWSIAKLLLAKKQYIEIERLTGASSATIAKVQESLKFGEGSFELLQERIK